MAQAGGFANPSLLALSFLLLVQLCYAAIITEKNGNTDKYIVAFDAGSQGTTVHIFRFDENSNILKIKGELTIQFGGESLITNGVNQTRIACVLAPLLQKAVNVIPVKLRSVTPLILGATDEMILLGEDKLKEILKGVRNVFSKSSLLYDSKWVKVLPGAEQGVYLWATVNYLLGNLKGNYENTVSLLDQERAMVETTYAVSKQANSEVSIEKDYITKYYFNGTKYYLYSHGYLGYGAYAARGEILKYTNDSYTYCVVNDYNVQYDYYGVVYNVRSPPSGSNYEKCEANIRKAVNLNAPCSLKSCTFNGVWNGGGGAGVKNLYMSTGFHHTGSDLGLVNSAMASSAVTLMKYGEKAKQACIPRSLEEATILYPHVDSDDLPYLCMDLVYLYFLLVDGLAIEPTKVITAVNEVQYGDSYLEVFWPLGAALEIVSSGRTKRSSIRNIPYSSNPSVRMV